MPAHIVTILLHAGDTVGDRDNRIRMLGGERTPARRTASLHEHRAVPVASEPCSVARAP